MTSEVLLCHMFDACEFSVGSIVVRDFRRTTFAPDYYLCSGTDPNHGHGFGNYQREYKKSLDHPKNPMMVFSIVYFVCSVLVVILKIKQSRKLQRNIRAGTITAQNVALQRSMPSRAWYDVIFMVLKICFCPI